MHGRTQESTDDVVLQISEAVAEHWRATGRNRYGVQGVHLSPLGLYLNPLGLFLRTSVLFIWRIMSAFLRA